MSVRRCVRATLVVVALVCSVLSAAAQSGVTLNGRLVNADTGEPLPGAAVVSAGVWHLVEWFADLSDGTLQWWLDGVLHGSHRDFTNTHDFDMFQFSPTWGGNTGARKRHSDHYWFDHVRLSIR